MIWGLGVPKSSMIKHVSKLSGPFIYSGNGPYIYIYIIIYIIIYNYRYIVDLPINNGDFP